MKKILFVVLISAISLIAGWFGRDFFKHKNDKIQQITEKVLPRPLNNYSFENLIATQIPSEKIEIGEILNDEKSFTTHSFRIYLDPTLKAGPKKKVTGILNIPKGQGPFPVIVMFRGYVDQQIYKPGMGTGRAAKYFAENGFITIAPDFLGYGDSDSQTENIFEARFQTYTTGLILVKSLDAFPMWDGKNIFIWGYSNGGQIAITVLEILGIPIPTSLWAPVSKPFPYSVLYYTDESEDRGKFIRQELAKFEQVYDPDLYAIDLYYDRITAPIQLQQGTNDDVVPKKWSDELYHSLDKQGISVQYFVYPEADHDLKTAWNRVVARDVIFFKKFLR